MLEQVDRRLREWVTSTLEGVDVSLDLPGAKVKGPTVGLYLFELCRTPPARTTKRPPLQLSLRYLVTAQEARPEASHRLLGELMLAAMQDAELEVESEPVPLAFWTAFGTPPRPAFVLRVNLRVERDEPTAPLVRKPIRVDTAPLSGLEGLVLGPGDTPLAGAVVELPELRRLTETDHKGRFSFASVPSGRCALRVRAKGRETTVTPSELTAHDGEPMIIRFDRMEG